NHQTAREGGFKHAGEDRADCARRHRDEQPWKTKSKYLPRRRTPDLLEMKAEDFEDAITNRCRRTRLFFALAQNFLREKPNVDQANHAAFFVNDRKGEKFVEHEKLA